MDDANLPELPKEVRIIPYEIEPQAMLDFQVKIKELHGSEISKDIIEEDWLAIEEETLFKNTLVKAAILGNVEVFRKLEKIEQEYPHDDDRKQWIRLSLLYARMLMEQGLLDEPIGFIVSGLGGEGTRIRFCFVLHSDEVITKSLANLIASEYEELCKDYDAVWENQMDFTTNYIRFTLLMPFNTSPSPLIEEGIEKLTFLDSEYLESNMRLIEEEEINKWIKQLQS